MESSKICSSPTYRNFKTKQFNSPQELKEKLRKDYKRKVQDSRRLLLNRFRDSSLDTDLRSTLTNIYTDIFNDAEDSKRELLDSEESKILEEIKQELIQEELDWCNEEYQKSQNDVDWSVLQDENVLCPICQKNNFSFSSNILSCTFCNVKVKTTKSLKDIQNIIFDNLGMHANLCKNTAQFSTFSELNDTHIYLMCEICSDMKFIV